MTHPWPQACVLVCLCVALTAAAQDDAASSSQPNPDHEILREACGALKNALKQSSCLDALVRMEELVAQAPQRTPAENAAARKAYLKKKYAGVVRAFATIKTATANQVSYEKYASLIDAAAIELASVRPRAATESERQAILSFDRAVEEYRQAAKNWSAAGKFGLPASSFVVPKWRLARDAVKEGEGLLLDPSQGAAR